MPMEYPQRPLLAPGLTLTYGISLFATALGGPTNLSPLLWAAIIGMAAGSFWPSRFSGAKEEVKAGITFAKARLLRLGIVLYGVKLTVQQIAGIGAAGLLTDLFTLTTAFPLGILLGRALKIDAPLAALITTGAGICGCSAVAAAAPVVEAESHEVAAAVGTVVLCGTSAMFLYPLLFSKVPFLAANPQLMGIYTGASVHELAGVVAAGNAMGPSVSTIALVTKLLRVCMLAPILIIMSTMPSLRVRTSQLVGGSGAPDGGSASTRATSKPPLPWFALGFILVASVNSVLTLDKSLIKLASTMSATCLAMAMAALGLDTDLGKIRKLGPRPVVLAATLWAWLLFGVGGMARLLVVIFP